MTVLDMRNRTYGPAAVFLAALFFGTGVQLLAFHQWGCFAWSWPTASGRLDLGYSFGQINSNRDYFGALFRARDVWNTAPPINLFVSSSPQLTWEAQPFGFTGWLGLGTINVNGCRILSGNTKLNDTYLGDAVRYSQINVDHVACQEVGHTFGLEHDETRNDTCMNDRILNAGAAISSHDREEIRQIYPTSTPPPPPSGQVIVTPSAVAMSPGQSQRFTANHYVRWSLNHNVGTIVPDGNQAAIYTAPPTVGSGWVITVTATSTAVASISGTAAINFP